MAATFGQFPAIFRFSAALCTVVQCVKVQGSAMQCSALKKRVLYGAGVNTCDPFLIICCMKHFTGYNKEINMIAIFKLEGVSPIGQWQQRDLGCPKRLFSAQYLFGHVDMVHGGEVPKLFLGGYVGLALWTAGNLVPTSSNI